MDVLLLGTGSADGWPNPFCECRSCAAMRAAGEVRAQTAALVDGTLMLECGPDAPRSAARLGRSLAGVRHLLVTHAHPDHWGPPALMWRSWTQARHPLDIVGPPAVLASVAEWAGEQQPVRPHAVKAGDRLRVGGYNVRVLAAAHSTPTVGPAVLYDLTGPDGTRLLWATDTGPLPARTLDEVRNAAYDVVLLEETAGDAGDAGPHHHDLKGYAATVAELRRRGAVTTGTRVAAIHLGHGNPAPPELDDRLRAWGVQAPRDGTAITIAPDGHNAWPAPRRVLVLGGARSGKSAIAERMLAAEPSVTYLATAADRPGDAEWAARVRRHRERRPGWWQTVENADVPAVLRSATAGDAILVDDLGLWLDGVLTATSGWAADARAGEATTAALDALLAAWLATPARVVAVAPEVGAGIVPATPAGRRFRDELGTIAAGLAAGCDEVWLVTAGLPRRLR